MKYEPDNLERFLLLQGLLCVAIFVFCLCKIWEFL
jgi:hypothetical protein